MNHEHEADLQPCVIHLYDVISSDGRAMCSVCGQVQPRHEDVADCLDCGVCEWCIDRSIAAWGDWYDLGGEG